MNACSHAFRRLISTLLVLVMASAAPGLAAGHAGDPHYTKPGFFDIHVCNWPDQPPFLLSLFSTFRWKDIERVEIVRPDGQALGTLDLSRYRILHKKGKPEKHVFITHFPVGKGVPAGWYHAHVFLRDGTEYAARDFVSPILLSRPTNLAPAGVMDRKIATRFRWSPVAGARYYVVYLKDLWNDGKIIFKSKPVTSPRVTVPKNLLKAGGLYEWRVNARDSNHDRKLGDFNSGSLSRDVSLSIAEN